MISLPIPRKIMAMPARIHDINKAPEPRRYAITAPTMPTIRPILMARQVSRTGSVELPIFLGIGILGQL